MAEPVVFSVSGQGHTSDGNPDILSYDPPAADVGHGWVAPATFKVPVSGIYFFTLSFVKDAYYQGGTEDDVFVRLRKNGTEILASAWSGEGSGKRGTGTVSVAIKLHKDDAIDTVADSDGGVKRYVAQYQLTGFLIPGSATAP